MLYEVTHFRKAFYPETSRGYGIITVYFKNNKPTWSKRLSLTKFLTLSHMLENDKVFFNPQTKFFETRIESSKFK